MWVFGGMTDLQERADFWRFDFGSKFEIAARGFHLFSLHSLFFSPVSRRWRPVKSKPGPGCLHSHCAVKFLSVMILFGGEREGQTLNEMWRFHFGTAKSQNGKKFPFSLHENPFVPATEFWEKLSFVSNQPMPRAQCTSFIFSQFTTRGNVHYMGLPEQEYNGSRPEPAFETTRKDDQGVYTFDEGPETCCDNDDEDEDASSSFRSKPTNRSKVFKPGVLTSQVRMRTSVALQSYTNNQSNLVDHIKDMRRQHQGHQNFERLGQQKPQQSQLKDLAKFNLSRLSSQACSYSMFSNESTESLNTVTSSAAESPCSVRMARAGSSQHLLKFDLQEAAAVDEEDGLASVVERGNKEDRPSTISRDPVSVPNFKNLSRSGSLEGDDGKAASDLEKAANLLRLHDGNTELKSKLALIDFDLNSSATNNKPSTSNNHVGRSDSAYTFQSYDCSSSRSSTLSSNESSGSDGCGGGGKTGGNSSILPTSISQRFSELAAKLDNPDEDNNKAGFANPHYLSPEVQAMLEKKRLQRTNVLLRDDSHQSFAQALNSPADSLFSDYQEFHARLNQDFVELNNFPGDNANPPPPTSRSSKPQQQRPKSAHVSETSEFSTTSIKSSSSSTRPSSAQPRPLSTVDTSAPIRDNKVSPINDKPADRDSVDGGDTTNLLLLMFVVGGREVGQVTVFRRPISLWKLDLTKTF